MPTDSSERFTWDFVWNTTQRAKEVNITTGNRIYGTRFTVATSIARPYRR